MWVIMLEQKHYQKSQEFHRQCSQGGAGKIKSPVWNMMEKEALGGFLWMLSYPNTEKERRIYK